MTALAANGLTVKDRRAEAVDCIGDMVCLVAVTEQAVRGDWPGEAGVALLIARRQVPAVLCRVPGKRGGKKVAVVVDQICPAALPGADGEIDRKSTRLNSS